MDQLENLCAYLDYLATFKKPIYVHFFVAMSLCLEDLSLFSWEPFHYLVKMPPRWIRMSSN